MTYLRGKGLGDFFRVAGPLVHGLVGRLAGHHRNRRRTGRNAALLRQGGPRAVFFVFGNTEAEFTRMTQGRAVKLSGDAAQHVNEDEADGTANTGIGPAVIRQDIMAGVQPDLLPNGTVDHNKLGAATGAGGAAVQIELRPAYGFDDGDDHGHIGR